MSPACKKGVGGREPGSKEQPALQELIPIAKVSLEWPPVPLGIVPMPAEHISLLYMCVNHVIFSITL